MRLWGNGAERAKKAGGEGDLSKDWAETRARRLQAEGAQWGCAGVGDMVAQATAASPPSLWQEMGNHETFTSSPLFMDL